MSCEKFRKFELGKLKKEEFQEHLKACSICRESARLDTGLMSLAAQLKRPVESPSLWSRIEASLVQEQEAQEFSRGKSPRWLRLSFFPAAALFFFAISIGLYFWLQPSGGEQRLLAQTALKKVEKAESQYLKAIEVLEQRVLPKMANLDLELMLLYRDRLETIDEQIERCRGALTQNPANAHIRRYMLAALLDKKQTLREILSYQPHLEERP